MTAALMYWTPGRTDRGGNPARFALTGFVAAGRMKFGLWGVIMKKIVGFCLALVMLTSSLTPASAAMVPVAPVTGGSSVGFGPWLAGGIIGVAAFLGIYDFGRRTTCSGDFLNLGGPGFTAPITPGMSVITQSVHPLV